MDELDNLPVDKSKQMSPAETDILKRYFGDNKTNKKLLGELKEVIIATVLFMVMTTSFFDKCLEYLPYTGSPLIKMGLKALTYATLLYVAIIMLQ